ncbi:hypothetical protein EL84_25925 [Paenibacillus sp. VT-400]|nr:hypothetical protein EL84_25925 [Paenibacillus sp. VT-400]
MYILLQFIDKLFSALKFGIYSAIALYTYFQLILTERDKVSDILNSNLTWYILIAAILEAAHNLYNWVTDRLPRERSHDSFIK